MSGQVDTAPKVYAAIAAVGGELAKAGIGKDRKNVSQGYAFRGIDDVYNALAPMLAKHGLVVLPRCVSRECIERQTRNGSPLFYVTVCAEFDFVAAADGSRHTARTYGEAMDSADKATNKAMSAAYKYAAFQTFCIPTEGDNDADQTTPEPAAAMPEGYGESWRTMQDAATRGTGALQEAWKASSPDFRRIVSRQYGQDWDDLKASAAKVAA